MEKKILKTLLKYDDFDFGENSIKLHLGCGKKKFKGFVNIDYDKKLNLDLVLNLEKEKLPYKDNSVDYIFTGLVFEHLNVKGLRHMFSECYRVLKKGGVLKIFVPHFTSRHAFSSPVHISQFSTYSFEVQTLDFKYSMGFKKYYTKIIFIKGFISIFKSIFQYLVNYSQRTQQLYEGTILRSIVPAHNIIGILVK